MKVRQLVDLLSKCDADAEVVIATAPHWPMEHRVAGVALRADCHALEGDTKYDADASSGDVLLVEGGWRRYGHRSAWDVARTTRD